MKKYWVLRSLRMLAILMLAIVVFGFLVETLWNLLVPELFGLRAITFWQAVGLLVLSRTLVGGFHRGGGSHWKHRIHAKLEGMTAEERDRFRAGLTGDRMHRRDAFGSSSARANAGE